MDQSSNQFFATAKPWKLFIIVALPGLISMLSASLYQAFEGAFVGKLIGEAAFAAVNLAMPVVFINFALADLIGVGSSVPISVSLGRKDNKKASNVFTCSIIMIFLAGIIMGLILYFTSPFFVGLMVDGNEALAALAVKYVRVYAIMSPVTTIVFATDNYLRISGFVKGSMFLNIFMTILTVTFLFIFLGVLKMDVEGSALASCCSMFICAIIALIPFIAKKSILKFVKPQFSFKMIREIVFCGLPIFLNNIAGRITAIIMNSALYRFGGQTGIAAYAVLMYSSGVVEPMLYGISDSVQPAVGYNWGAKSLNRVRDITKCSLIVCGMISIACTLLMVLCPQLLASIFVDKKDIELMELSIHAMKLFGYAFIFGWFSFAIQGFFGAIEKPLPATVLSVCRALVFPVALIYCLEFLGLDGLWLNYVGTAILTAVMAVIMLIFIQKKLPKDIMIGKIKGEQSCELLQ